MNMLIQDLRFSLRQFRRSPGFTATAVLTLALGIGGTTAVLSIANALYFRSLPIPEAERVVTVLENRPEGDPAGAFSYPDYLVYQEGAPEAFSELAVIGNSQMGLRTDAGAEPLAGALVSGNYFQMLGVQPALGRFLLPDEDAPGRAAVAVLSHETWRTRFGGDPGVLGRVVHINGHQLTVVGVAPRGFRGTQMTTSPEVWVPLASRDFLVPGLAEQEGRTIAWLSMHGRLAEGVERTRAVAMLSAVGQRLSPERSQSRQVSGVQLTPAGSIPLNVRGTASTMAGILVIASGLVLLIASTNVAGMMMARAMQRRREVAVRLALGAGSGRLVRQLLTESGLLFLIGGAVGVLVAYRLTDLAGAFLSTTGGPLPLGNVDPTPDAAVLVVALLISLIAGVVFGLAPSLQATRVDLAASLKEGSANAGTGRSPLRSFLVVGQVAMCVLILVGAGLFIRALHEAAQVDLGMEARGVLTGRMSLAPHGYDAERGLAFYQVLTERLAATPGVLTASVSQSHPLAGWETSWGMSIGGEDVGSVPINAVDGAYFATLGIPLVQGRSFDHRDRADAPGVAIVNESLARQYFPGMAAIGRTIEMPGGEREIVGIVGDSKWSSLEEEGVPFAYLPLEQAYPQSVSLLVRTSGDPSRLEGAIRREVGLLHPDLALQGVTTLSETVAQLTLPQRIAAWSAGAFGVVGLLLAVVGLYGVLAFAVTMRTREMGLRMALGASVASVIRLVLRQGVLLVTVGAAIGIGASLALTPLVGDLLLGVDTRDPLAFVTVVVLLFVVAMLASYLPARRATRVDPMVALRAE
jgi:predicted permease